MTSADRNYHLSADADLRCAIFGISWLNPMPELACMDHSCGKSERACRGDDRGEGYPQQKTGIQVAP